MRVAAWLVVIAALCAPAPARAEHDHGAVPHPPGSDDRPFAASVGLVAASYETMLYVGDYQAVVPGLRWSHGRFGVSASLGMYRLTENGRTVYGAGDAVATGTAALIERGRAAAGLSLAASAPTGDHQTGLGMGHPMVMPAAWGSYAIDRVTLSATAGAGVAIGGSAEHAGHGSWPIVDPMSQSELTAGASVAVAVTPALQAGARATGALAIGEGESRLAAGLRGAWTTGRVETSLELQAGVVGDPFTFRGVVATSLTF